MTRSDTLTETAHAPVRRSTTCALPIDATRPMGRLWATLTAGIAVLALMLATALPAQADRQSDNLAKALIAALAVGAIVHSIDKRKAKPAPTTVRNPIVPRACAIEVGGARSDRVFYTERCLKNQGFNYRLPRGCAIDIRTRGRVDRAYGEQCLRKAGFRIGGQARRDDWRRDDRGGRTYNYNQGRGRGGYGY